MMVQIGYVVEFFRISLFSVLAVTLSKTQKKGRDQKENLVSSVRESFDKYLDVYVFEFENMKNAKFKSFREQINESSRFVHTFLASILSQ